jgi:predicted negative regulator of RcsB-dependent stress response
MYFNQTRFLGSTKQIVRVWPDGVKCFLCNKFGIEISRALRLRLDWRRGKIHVSLTMQTQDAPAELLFKIWPWLEANKKRILIGSIAVVALGTALFLYSSAREEREVAAGRELTTVLSRPNGAATGAQLASSLEQLAANYSSTAAGRRAQLQAAGVLFTAGNYTDALTQFRKCLEADRSGPFAAIAQLGIAACSESLNNLDQAAAAYQQILSTYPGSPLVSQAEFGLGHVAEMQNKASEAIGHYEKVAGSSAGGSLAQEASLRATELRLKMAAATPAPAQPAAAKPAATVTPLPAAKP